MIENQQSSLRFLKKTTFSGEITQSRLMEMWSDITDFVGIQKESVNSLNDNMLDALNVAAKESKLIYDRLSIISSALADVLVVSGKSSTSFSPFHDNVKVKELGAHVDKNLFQIRLDNQSINPIPLRTVDIDAKNGSLGNAREYSTKTYADINNIITTASWVEIESYDTSLLSVLKIGLIDEQVINNIQFRMINYGVRYPEIVAIETSIDGINFSRQKILASNDYSFAPDDFNIEDGNISLDLADVRAKNIRIIFSQKMAYSTEQGAERYAIGINALSVNFVEAVDSGNLILGPYSSDKEILKVAIGTELINVLADQGVVTLYVSYDNEQWLNVANSSVLDEKSRKVISFNTTDSDSIPTENPVKQIWIKVALEAIDKSAIASTNQPVERLRSTLTNSNSRFFVNQATEETVVFRSKGFIYGKRHHLPVGAIVQKDPATVDVEVNSHIAVRSLGFVNPGYLDVTKGSVRISEDQPVSISKKLDHVKVNKSEVHSLDANYDCDPYKVKLFKGSKPAIRQVKTRTQDHKVAIENSLPVIVSGLPAGTYYLKGEGLEHKVDLSAGVFFSSSELLYLLPNGVDRVYVVDELNRRIASVAAQEAGSVKYVSLLEAFQCSIPVVDGMVFSTKFPLEALGENEFTIVYGQLRFGKNLQVDAQVHLISLDEVSKSVQWGINKKVNVLLNETKEIKAQYALTGHDYEKAIALKHTNLIEGSVRFDASKASVNAFMREVPFQDGFNEFKVGSRMTLEDNQSKSVIYLHEDFVDNGSIVFEGQEFLFRNRVYSEDELISEGDWMVVFTNAAPYIKLPEGIYTSDIYDVKVTFSVESTNVATGGLYSIDYKNGIAFTAAPIDEATEVSYLYSYVFAEYEAMEQVDNQYVTVTEGSIEVDPEQVNGEDYVALIKKPNPAPYKFKVSPILSDFRVNLITAGDVL